MLRSLVRFGVILAAALAILAFPAALALDHFAGRDAWFVADGKDPAIVALEKAQWKADHPGGKGADPKEIADLYGSRLGGAPLRVVLVSADRLVTPAEDPSMSLLLVEKSRENPLQMQTVNFFARWTAIGAAITALLGLVLLRLLRRKSPAA